MATPDSSIDIDGLQAEPEQKLEAVRIPATAHLIVGATHESVLSTFGDASMVMVPTRLRQSKLLGPMERDFYTLVAALPLTAAIVAANPVDLVAGPETCEYSLICSC